MELPNQQQKQLQQQMRDEKMKNEAQQEGSPGFDFSAFAGLAVGKPVSLTHYYYLTIFEIFFLDSIFKKIFSFDLSWSFDGVEGW